MHRPFTKGKTAFPIGRHKGGDDDDDDDYHIVPGYYFSTPVATFKRSLNPKPMTIVCSKSFEMIVTFFEHPTYI